MERAMVNWWYMRVDPHVGRDASRWKFCHQCRSVCRGVCERPPQSLDPVGNALALRLWSFGTLFFADPTQTPVDATLKLDKLIDWTPFLELFEYDRDRRPAARLARTVHAVRLVRACHWQLDAAELKEFGQQPDVNQWMDQLSVERNERVIILREIGVEQPEDPDESVELQTLLLHSSQSPSGETVLMPEECNLMDVFYKSLVKSSGVMVLTVPEWFVPRHDVDAKLTQWLGSTVDICELEGADAQEEAVVYQATLWSAVNHPHVAKLWGACHVGATRFVIQELTVPLAKVPLASWTVWRDCALGLRFLFECGLPHEVFSHELIAKIHDRPKFVLLGRGLVCRERDEFLALFVANARVFAELIAAWRQRRDQRVEAADQQAETSDQQPIRRVELSERPETWTNAEWTLYDRLHTCDANNVHGAIVYAVIALQDIVESECEQSPPTNSKEGQPNAEPGLESLEDKCDEIQTIVEVFTLEHLYEPLVYVHERIVKLGRAVTILVRSAAPEELSGLAAAIEALTLEDGYNVETGGGVAASALAEDAIEHIPPTVTDDSAVANGSLAEDTDATLVAVDESPLSAASTSFRQIVDLFGSLTRKLCTDHHPKDFLRSTNQAFDVLKHKLDELSALLVTLIKHNFQQLPDLSNSGTGTDDDQAHTHDSPLGHYEVTKRRGYYTSLDLSDATTFDQDPSSFPPFPRWFIPPCELELDYQLEVNAGFGEIWRGRWFGMKVIMKRLKATPLIDLDGKFQKTFAHEADIWFSLNHPNIARLYGACHIGKHPYYVCEYAKRGTLTEFLDQSHDREGWMWRLLLGAARGLHYIHELGIVHKDLKCNNILVSEDIRAWLADFGMSESSREEANAPIPTGAFHWRAPEVLRGDRATSASDVFSFGMCIVEAVTGNYPWGTTPEIAVRYRVCNGTLLTKPFNVNDDAWAIVAQMNKSDPADRIEMPRVVQLLEGMVRSQ